jgi:hypothetical protein
VGDLQKENFQVFDNDKPRVVSAFTVERRPAADSNSGNNVDSGAEPSAAANAPPHFIVFLFDDLHLSLEDLAHTKEAGVKALDGLLGGSDTAAVVSLSGKVDSGLTRDRAKLQEAILSLKSQGDYLRPIARQFEVKLRTRAR